VILIDYSRRGCLRIERPKRTQLGDPQLNREGIYGGFVGKGGKRIVHNNIAQK